MSAINNPLIYKDGFLKSRTKNNQTTTYTYDIFGNLKQVKTPTKTIQYLHNPNHQIIAKKINNQIVEKYLWQGLKLLAVYDKDDKLITRYFYANERVPYKMQHNNKTYYLYYNQIHSLKLITDENNKIIKQLDYDTYGNLIKDTNINFKTHITYAGGFYDSDTKLIRFGKRDYSPEQRRWTATDPIGFSGGDFNLYGYVLNDPVQFVDPEGLNPQIIKGGYEVGKMGKECIEEKDTCDDNCEKKYKTDKIQLQQCYLKCSKDGSEDFISRLIKFAKDLIKIIVSPIKR